MLLSVLSTLLLCLLFEEYSRRSQPISDAVPMQKGNIDNIMDKIIDETIDKRADSTVFGSRAINFLHSNGPYTLDTARTDFGNIQQGWNPSRATITGDQCRISILKNALSSASGMIAKYNVTQGTAYTTNFKVKYDSSFEWCTGGKVGPGFFMGDEAAGGAGGSNGQGGSARLVWHKHPSTGEVYFQAYAYYKDQASIYGDTLGRFPAAGSSLQQDTWYDVTLYVKSNTGTKKDGQLRLTINGQSIVDQAMRWTTNNSKRFINRMEFATFRGGATDDYKSSTDSYIYFDQLTWRRLAA